MGFQSSAHMRMWRTVPRVVCRVSASSLIWISIGTAIATTPGGIRRRSGRASSAAPGSLLVIRRWRLDHLVRLVADLDVPDSEVRHASRDGSRRDAPEIAEYVDVLDDTGLPRSELNPRLRVGDDGPVLDQ